MTKVSIKTAKEIEIMREGGRRLAQVREEVAAAAKPGSTGIALDKLADKLITKLGGEASFKMVPGYHWATCININETVVHGIPDGNRLHVGDVVGIDIGMYFKGFHTDTSTTVVIQSAIGATNPKRIDFLEAGKAALAKALSVARPGKRIWDVSWAMQDTIEKKGYSVVKALTGHGIGRALHEEPAIPCFVVGDRKDSPKITAGMALAIEVMYNQGTDEVVYKNRDGWTIITADDKMSGLFEETVAVTENGSIVLTKAHYDTRPTKHQD